ISVQKQAQRLVDYFATCLQNGTIRKPIAYFINLKNRLLKGQLDLSEMSSSENKTRAKQQKKVNQELPTLQAEYQLAIADYQYVKRTVESVRHNDNLSFDEAAASIGFTPIWQKAVKRVDSITEQLNVYQKKNASMRQSVSSDKEPSEKERGVAKRASRERPQPISDILNSLELLPS
ncbi:MAG: hypothetical protein KAG20_03430, partial [Cocleimonas sp.]|nr:hypothetical protein [Cocleimonas sp.]